MGHPTVTPPVALIRKTDRNESDIVANILGTAFASDPVMTWIFPESPSFARYYFYALTRDFFLGHHEVYITTDGTGAAMWLPPRVSLHSFPILSSLALIRRAFADGGLKGFWRGLAVVRYFDHYHPAEPHFYLHAVGVLPVMSGRGIGSALLREVLERCDREGIPAYLENTNRKNLPLYERAGFKIMAEGHIPRGGPSVWFMMRRPAD